MSDPILNKAHECSFTIADRIALIKAHPCFLALTDDDLKEIALLAHESQYIPNQVIIHQNDIVDSIHLIACGTVEVAKKIDSTLTAQSLPVAMLQKGDAIGLNKTGFFTNTGLRTATLTALSNVTLIGWRLSEFYEFIKKHPSLSQYMRETAEFMLRIDFIRQVTPFVNLPIEYLSELAREIQEIDVSDNTFIFLEGDQGNACYLIYSGEVEISTKNQNDDHILGLLTKGMIFGEMALLSECPRNATAKMHGSGKLLVIKSEQLKKLMLMFQPAADYIWVLAAERSRPKKNEHIEIYERETDDLEKIYILKNIKNKNYFKLSAIGMFIWRKLDGKHTIEDIAIAILKEFKVFIPDIIADTIVNLTNNGFITTSIPFASTNTIPLTQTTRDKVRSFFSRYFIVKYKVDNINPIITRTFRNFFYLFYMPIAQFIFGMIAVTGITFFVLNADQIIDLSFDISQFSFISLIVLLYILNISLSFIHELAHAYTTKMYGHEVNRIGVAFYWIGIVAYTDTSDMWLSSNKNRAIVSLAGPYVDVILAGIFSLGACVCSQTELTLLLWFLALLLYISAFRNLNPINDGDGYNVLVDICNHPTLKKDAYQWLIKKPHHGHYIFHSKKILDCVLIYWFTAICFLLVALLFSLLVRYYLLLFLPDMLFGIETVYLLWLLPIYVCILFYYKSQKV